MNFAESNQVLQGCPYFRLLGPLEASQDHVGGEVLDNLGGSWHCLGIDVGGAPTDSQTDPQHDPK